MELPNVLGLNSPMVLCDATPGRRSVRTSAATGHLPQSSSLRLFSSVGNRSDPCIVDIRPWAEAQLERSDVSLAQIQVPMPSHAVVSSPFQSGTYMLADRCLSTS